MKQQLRIGIFLAAALVIMAVFIFIVGDLGRFFRKPGYSVYISFGTVAGLDPSATVRMSGVKIGYVRHIRLEGRRPLVEMSLEPGAKIPKNSKATLSSLGLLGEKYVEILPSEESSFYKAGETMGSLASVSFDQLGLLILSIGNEVKSVSAQVQKLIGDENQERFGEVLTNLSQATQGLSDFLKTNRDELDKGIRSASHAFQDFDRTVNELSASLQSSAQSLKSIVEDNRAGVKGSLDKVRDVLDRMDDAARKLNGILDKVDKGEGSLGQLVAKPELYEQAKEAVENVGGIVRPLASLKAGADAQGAYYATSELLKGSLTFSLRLATGPFLQAQIVRDPFRERFSYSLQGGRRLGPFAPRAGIIESDFGVGLDYYTLQDRLMFSLEGFEFNRQPGPRFRLASRFYPDKFFYLILGLDDLTWKRQREIFFGLGVGVR